MTISTIIDKYKHLTVREERGLSEDYLELVFLNKDALEWNKLFEEILGPVAKPAGKEPSKEQFELTKEHGGVMDNQTLYMKDFGTTKVLAMFWPWQDKQNTTLKVILLKKK